MSDQGNYGGGTDDSGGLSTPPTDSHPEKLTDQQRLSLPKGAFTAPASTVHIPMLDGAKNWDHWYNSLLGMCEMTDIDGILTGEDEIPIQGEKETLAAYNNAVSIGKQPISTLLAPYDLAETSGPRQYHRDLQRPPHVGKAQRSI